MVIRFLGLLILLLVCRGQAQSIRVVTWDLERVREGAGGGSQLRKAAGFLQQFDADVILLQSVSGWPACQELAEALEPKSYNVVICSSFRSDGSPSEVAILAKRTGRVGWSERWDDVGGCSFAALPFGDKMVGFFSVRFPHTSTEAARAAREAACRKLLVQMEDLEAWEDNRVEVLVVGGNFATSPEVDAEEQTLSWLEEAGFANAYFTVARENRLSFRGQPGEPEATFDYLLVKSGAFVSPPSLLLAEGFLHRPVAAEIDPRRVSAPTTWVEQVLRSQVERRVVQEQARAKAAADFGGAEMPRWPLWAGGTLLLLAVGFSLWWWRLSVRLRSSQVWALSRSPKAGYLEGAAGTEALPAPHSDRALVADEPAERGESEAAHWRERAEVAERRAAEATQIVKQGLLPPLVDWFKQTFLRKLVAQRSDLLEGNRHATDHVRALEEQVARISGGMQDRISTYQQRIHALEKELACAQAEKRDLIAARIRLTKDQLERAKQAVPERN